MDLRAVLLICVVSVVSDDTNNDNLKAVLQIFRHGQRTPKSLYPTDPYSNLTTYWEGLNYGQLTKAGKRQQYALGKFTRARYSGFLPTTYSEKDIYVQTTDVDRAHMSVQANLFGLYPAIGPQVWIKGTTWQPIPIHPSDPKIVYPGGVSPCKALITLLANLTIKENEASNSKYASLYSYLTNCTRSTINSLDEAFTIYDTLVTEEAAGLTLPSWTSAVYPEPLQTIATWIFARYTYTTQLTRLMTGGFFNNLLKYFEGIIAGTSSSAKYQLFSAHDCNIFSILTALDNTPTKPVPPTISLWFELRAVNNVNVVNLWMKSGTNLTQLSIAGCTLDCPLSTMKTLLSDILLDADTLDRECNL